MKNLLMLVDCNNFFVSCERVFNPKLCNEPVVILSNADGCVISRSNEVKALDIPMGTPFFKIKALIQKHNVKFFSPNFTLYKDMFRRLMSILQRSYSNMEVYSIDETFLGLEYDDPNTALKEAKEIKERINQWLGIPATIGIAYTKTLAKLANAQTQLIPAYKGICSLLDEKTINEVLKTTPVEEIWGIDKQKADLLKFRGIRTAFAFKLQSIPWIQKHLSIVGTRLARELSNSPCIEMGTLPSSKKKILRSRIFTRPMLTLSSLDEAAFAHTIEASSELRSQQSTTSAITLFIGTDSDAQSSQHYNKSITLTLEESTDYIPYLVKTTQQLLSLIYNEDVSYRKVGITLLDIQPKGSLTRPLFSSGTSESKREKLMRAFDDIRDYWGKDTQTYAATEKYKTWEFEGQFISPRYTTHWDELLSI